MVGSDDLQRTIQYVAADLHNDLIFTGDAAKRHHVIDRDTLLGKTLLNGARAEGGRGDQTAKQRWRVGGEIEIGNDAFQTLVGIGCTATIEPVEHHRQVIQGRIFRPGVGERWQ
ncbi:Uncharacterised protein [Salmonella enterica subsp. enterica serovar Typhi]|nr:Uncharacterised protein [Salmonella enterica subsp. enterica serovar Typhi]